MLYFDNYTPIETLFPFDVSHNEIILEYVTPKQFRATFILN